MKLEKLATITQSTIEDAQDLEISSIAAIPNEAQADQLALIFASKFAKAKKSFKDSQARVFLISEELNSDTQFKEFKATKTENLSFLICKRPKYSLKLLISYFEKARMQVEPGIHPSAVIDPSAEIDPEACIAAHVVIGANTKISKGSQVFSRVTLGANVTIGEDCIIKSGVVIEDYCEIGDRCIFHPNAVIGSDGYSYVTQEASNLEKMQKKDFSFCMDRQVQHKINSTGAVIIGNDVEVGSNTCIDRGSIGPTRIGDGTKIDNLCQIAHNVQIGKDCLIIAQVGIAGSAKIGDRVTMAGGSGCGDGVEIGNDAVVGAKSAANSDIDPFMPVLGLPAIAYGEFMKRQRALARLPRQQEELRKLKSKVDELTKH